MELCEKCSHFRLMMAVEEMKNAQPETCEKYFVYYKVNFERPPRGNILKLTRVVWKSTQTLIISCCLFKHFSPTYDVKTADNNFLRSGRDNNIRRGTLPVSGVYLNNFPFIICLTPSPLDAVDMTFKTFQKARNFLL